MLRCSLCGGLVVFVVVVCDVALPQEASGRRNVGVRNVWRAPTGASKRRVSKCFKSYSVLFVIFGTTGAQPPLCVTFCARCFWRARGFCGLLGAPCWPACGLEAGPRRFLFILGRLGPLRGSLQHWHRSFFDVIQFGWAQPSPRLLS